MHIIGLWEGYWHSFVKFMEFWDGKMYKNGNAKVRPRIIIPIHFGINECGKEEFLKDLKSFSSCGEFNLEDGKWTNKENSGHGLKNKIKKLAKWIRRLFPQIKDINKEMLRLESSKLREKESKLGNHFIGSFYPLGEVDDPKDKEGREVV